MYSRSRLLLKYIQYYFTASNSRGHGVHSPFIFDFIQNVLLKKDRPAFWNRIEQRRAALLKDNSVIEVKDFGAGSGIIKSNHRVVSRIAASSLKPAKYASLLGTITAYYNRKKVIELGTSFGITTAYLAAAKPEKVITLEGAAPIASIARATFTSLDLSNVELIEGDIDVTLPQVLASFTPDLVFVDGNHRKEPVIRYFRQLLPASCDDTMLIFDDIHWSREMEEAWEEIKDNPHVTMTIDLFFIGIVLFRKEFKVKQHFSIRY